MSNFRLISVFLSSKPRPSKSFVSFRFSGYNFCTFLINFLVSLSRSYTQLTYHSYLLRFTTVTKHLEISYYMYIYFSVVLFLFFI